MGEEEKPTEEGLAPVDFEHLIKNIDEIEMTTVSGRITETVGMIIRAVVPNVKVGEVCLVKREGMEPLMCEVVGFTAEEVILSPLGEMIGVGPSSEVIPTHRPLSVRVGPNLLGRILDALGRPLDEATKGPLIADEYVSVQRAPPDPTKRKIIKEPISVGIRVLDGVLCVGLGQRVGVFAAAGGGKSTLMGMIARNAVADVNVISLVGERGRELREFIEKDLGPEGLKRSVLVISTSDQASQFRLNAAYVGTAIAEYFRDQGKSVILMMDSVTRFARAIREVGLAAGEPPARGGYTPSVFSTLPRLLERSGNSDKGSITAFYTILVAGDDMNEPVADETRSILDGHIILSRALAARNHYPAIDIAESISRVMDSIIDEDHKDAARKLREVVANYEKERDLILIGAYEEGSDPKVDYALEKIEEVNNFLKQRVDDRISLEEAVQLLKEIFS